MADTRLDGSTEGRLSASLRALASGERGWITLEEAQALFSADDDPLTALSEFDELGLRAVGEFAAQNGCDPKREGDRVYFRKK